MKRPREWAAARNIRILAFGEHHTAGNPARVIKTTHELKEVLLHHPDRLDTLNLPPDIREKIIKEHFKIA